MKYIIPFGKDQESEIGRVGTLTVKQSSRKFLPEDQRVWIGHSCVFPVPCRLNRRGSPRCPTCGNFFRWMESLQIWFDVMEPHWIYTHPWKWTAGTQKITQLKSGKSFEPNLHGFGFKMLFFRGVDSKWTFQWTLANLVTQDCCQNNRVLFVNHEGVMTRRCTFESIWWCKVELLDTWKILSHIKWDKMVNIPCAYAPGSSYRHPQMRCTCHLFSKVLGRTDSLQQSCGTRFLL